MSDLEILNAMAEMEQRRHELRRLLQEVEDAQRLLIVLGIWVTVGALLIAVWM